MSARLPIKAPEKAGSLRNKTADLTITDVKARQASKIREIGEALITTGFVSLDAQAKVLGLPRSTAWTILSTKHKGPGLRKDHLPDVEFKAAPPVCSGENHGIRGKSCRYLRWYEDAEPQIASKLKLNGPEEWATRMAA
jgi:hypothetical protein